MMQSIIDLTLCGDECITERKKNETKHNTSTDTVIECKTLQAPVAFALCWCDSGWAYAFASQPNQVHFAVDAIFSATMFGSR